MVLSSDSFLLPIGGGDTLEPFEGWDLVPPQKGCRCNRVDLIRGVEAGRLSAEVVLMARQPEVFVRALEPEEAQRLVKITRTTKDRIRLRRAGIVLASFQGRSATDAAAMFAASPQYVREVIHAFNEHGFAALDPKWSGGASA